MTIAERPKNIKEMIFQRNNALTIIPQSEEQLIFRKNKNQCDHRHELIVGFFKLLKNSFSKSVTKKYADHVDVGIFDKD